MRHDALSARMQLTTLTVSTKIKQKLSVGQAWQRQMCVYQTKYAAQHQQTAPTTPTEAAPIARTPMKTKGLSVGRGRQVDTRQCSSGV